MSEHNFPYLLKYRKWLVFLIAIGFLGCDRETLSPQNNIGHSYFPLQVGNTWVYEVEQREFFSNGTSISSNYQIQYEITSVGNDSTFMIKVSERADQFEDWETTGLYEAFKNQRMAVLNNGAASFIKLSFPVEAGRSWNGNAFNSRGEDIYRLDSIGASFTYHDITFENTITVIQEYSVDPIQITSDNVEIEVYAKNTGLVYKEQRNIDYKSCSSLYPECCTENSSEKCFGNIAGGFILTQVLIAHEN